MRVYATFAHFVVGLIAMWCTSLGNTVRDAQSAAPSARVGIETE